ncbi:MAG TPA: DUF2270 domain-containing protein [Polyangiaceae bacterium]
MLAPADRVAALSHLYRGELGRMTAYRLRLDTTTNWALGTTAAMITFAVGHAEIPHSIFGLALLLDVMFLWLEASRFRTYEGIRRRVRLLEEGFFGPVLGGPEVHGWESALASSLDDFKLPLTQWQAMSVRLRRSYLWLIASVYVGWYVKLSRQSNELEAAALGPIPGFLVVPLVLLPFIGLVALTFRYNFPEEG